jgi:hypothetical protein
MLGLVGIVFDAFALKLGEDLAKILVTGVLNRHRGGFLGDTEGIG